MSRDLEAELRKSERDQIWHRLKQFVAKHEQVKDLILQEPDATGSFALKDPFADTIFQAGVELTTDTRLLFERRWGKAAAEVAEGVVPVMAGIAPAVAVVECVPCENLPQVGIFRERTRHANVGKRPDSVRLTTTEARRGLSQHILFHPGFDESVLRPLRADPPVWEAGPGRSGNLAIPIRLRRGAGKGWQETLTSLRVYLDGDEAQANALYQALTTGKTELVLPGGGGTRVQVQPCGFEPAEFLIPPSRPAFGGFVILSEFFRYPFRQRFLNLSWEPTTLATAGADELVFTIRSHHARPYPRLVELLKKVGPKACQLNCVPVVNLARKQPYLGQVRHDLELSLARRDATWWEGAIAHAVTKVEIEVDSTSSVIRGQFDVDQAGKPDGARWHLDRFEPARPRLFLTGLTKAQLDGGRLIVDAVWCHPTLPDEAYGVGEPANRRWAFHDDSTAATATVIPVRPPTPPLISPPSPPPAPFQVVQNTLGINALSLLAPEDAAKDLQAKLKVLAGLDWVMSGEFKDQPIVAQRAYTTRLNDIARWLNAILRVEFKSSSGQRVVDVVLDVNEMAFPGSFHPFARILAEFFRQSSPLGGRTETQVIVRDNNDPENVFRWPTPTTHC